MPLLAKVVGTKSGVPVTAPLVSVANAVYDFIKKVLDNLVSHETEPAMKTLAAIKREAVLSINCGDNPRITLMKLTSLVWSVYPYKNPFFQELIQD
jgi:hypothetical protein